MADASHPYDRPTDPAKRHSAGLTDGPDRAGARSMLKAVGFTDEDLAKPLVGVGTTWIETMPCNLNQRRLAESRQGGHPGGRRHAHGVQHGLGQRRRDDGHRGDEGEPRQPRGHRRLDRARRPRPPARRRRLPHRLRQDDARRGDGPRPARRPRARPLQRHDLSRRVQGPAQRDRRVASTRRSARTGPARSRLDELYEVENVGVPGRRVRAAASSRPTRCPWSWSSSASRRPGSTAIPAEDPAKDAAALPRAARSSWTSSARDVRPSAPRDQASARERRSRRSRRPAARPTASCTCSRSPTSSASPLDIDEFGAVADRTPIVADMQPGGRYTATDMYEAGGIGARHARAAQARPAPRRRADRRRPDDRGDRRGGRRDARPEGRRADRDAAQADRRPGDPARLARARRLRREARRPRAARTIADRPASSTRRPTATRPSATGGSCRATSS